MQILDALMELGLNDKEARVYTSLLELGQSSGYAIAEKSGLKRPTVYVILDELRLKGLILKVPHAKKQLFTAKSPEDFFREKEDGLRAARGALPQLIAMANRPERKFKTTYYEGFGGLKDMFKIGNQEMKGKEMVAFFAKLDPKIGQEIQEKIMNEVVLERPTLGITFRGITTDDPSLKMYREKNWEFGYKIKWLNSKEYSSDASIEIGENFIQIASFRYLQGIRIENPDIAHTMRQIFEMIWKSRPEKVEGAID